MVTSKKGMKNKDQNKKKQANKPGQWQQQSQLPQPEGTRPHLQLLEDRGRKLFCTVANSSLFMVWPVPGSSSLFCHLCFIELKHKVWDFSYPWNIKIKIRYFLWRTSEGSSLTPPHPPAGSSVPVFPSLIVLYCSFLILSLFRASSWPPFS